MSRHGREEWFRRFAAVVFVAGAIALCAGIGTRLVRAQFSPAAGTGPGLPETIEAIDAARVTTRILILMPIQMMSQRQC
jgi:hypothetical protein